ncbi:sulfite exporter TauE/SafE family protein [Nitrosophilus alvini]|uniref:sulfite exporter TauE/SafE family protein n=1 Tax=Nitrosophilus alvini TaxID=2714855 RepID=UPI00190B7E55|nr:sulfite exporter TauE/SafE family protein [Nitrosophilus alvini]
MSIVTVAFLGSLGHCIGMCGGFVIAYTTAKVDPSKGKLNSLLAHLIYNTGRTFSYAIIGAVFGFLGSILLISAKTQGALYLAIGLFMVLMGISLTGNLKFLTSIEVSLTKYTFFKKLFSKLIHSKTLPSFFFLGMLNGFLPCGLVYFFAASAAATGSPFWGAIVMTIFGLSTIPVLFGLGTIAGFLKSSNFRNLMIRLASVVIILYGFYIIYKGYWFIFDPNASIHTCH